MTFSVVRSLWQRSGLVVITGPPDGQQEIAMVALNKELDGLVEETHGRCGATARVRGMGILPMKNSDSRSVPYYANSFLLNADFSWHYARNRNYSPSLGRFISQDPLQYPGAAAHCRSVGTGFRGVDAEPKCGEHRSLPLNINGANTYQFVMGNPINAVDPWGTQVYGEQPYIPSPLTPLPGPGTNYWEAASGVWNLGFGTGQMYFGAITAEFGGGLLAANGVFQANNGFYQIANGFGADWKNPVATSLWGALGAPKPVADVIGAFSGRSPSDAADAVDEAMRINDLLGDLKRWLGTLPAPGWGRPNPCDNWEIRGYEI